MGDGQVKDKLNAKPDVTEHQESTNRLRNESLETMARAGPDKLQDKGAGALPRELENPYVKHIGPAGVALRELERVKEKDGKKSATDADGKPLDMTVEQYRAKLLKTADSEFKLAINAADAAAKSDKYASEHNLPNVESNLRFLREREKKAQSFSEILDLKAQESSLEARKHAPSVTRCIYAEFLADSGNLVEAQKYYKDAGRIDSEARYDRQFEKLFTETDSKLRALQQQKVSDDQNPFSALDSAARKQKAGDFAGAEADYKKASELAAPMKLEVVQARLSEIEQAKKDNARDPVALQQLQKDEQAISSFLHVQALAATSYADFLISRNRSQDAAQLLTKVSKDDPQFARESQDFKALQQEAAPDARMKAASGASAAPFDNPFVHYEKFADAIKKSDMQTARSEIDAAVKAAENLDHKAWHEKRLAAEKELNTETDPDKRNELKQKVAILKQFDHAEAFTKLIHGEFELANKNFNGARRDFEAVQKDKEFAARPEVKMDELMQKSQEPSFWQKTWSWTKDFLKEASCDAAAILAGAVAGALAIETGPGALVAAGAAGSLAYMGMKKLVWKQELSWTDPLWGIADGLSGGGAAILRAGAVKVGEKVIARELATKMVTRGGASALELEGARGGLTAARMGERILGERVAELGKGLSFWERQASKVGFGEATYRTAYWSQKGLQGFNLATSVGINATTAAGGSTIYHGFHDGYKYAKGDYKSVGEFASAYSTGVLKDTASGAVFGTLGSSFVGGPAGGLANKFIRTESAAQFISKLGQVADTTWNAGAAKAMEALNAKDALKQIEETQKALTLPPKDDDEVQLQYTGLPQVSDDPADWQDQPDQTVQSDQTKTNQ